MPTSTLKWNVHKPFLLYPKRRMGTFSRILIVCFLMGWQSVIFCQSVTGDRPTANGKKNILNLNSYNNGDLWTDEVVRAVRETLQSQSYEVTLWSEFLDSKRHSEEKLKPLQFDYLQRKFQGIRFDLILATDDNAVDFLIRYRNELFGQVPVIFCGVQNPALISRIPRDSYAGLIERFEIHSLLDVALSLFPEKKNVVILTDNSLTNATYLETFQALEGRYPEIRFRYLNGKILKLSEILNALRRLPSDAFVICSSFTHDRDGTYYLPRVSAARIADASPVPIFSPSTTELGQGYLAGNRNGGYKHGRMAGQLAVNVLAGGTLRSIGFIEHSIFEPLFDYHMMERWNIRDSLLPPTATIVNRPPGFADFYHANRLLFWSGIAFILLQTLAIVVLFINILRRQAAERALRTSQAQLQHAQSVAKLGYWEQNPDTKEIVWSRQLYSILGLDPEKDSLSFQVLEGMIHPEDKGRVRQLLRESVLTAQTPPIEFRIQTPTGEVHHFQSQTKRIELPNGKHRILGTIHDITERKEMEHQVLHAQRIESLGNLAGGIAHDFNNLLTVINGYTHLLVKTIPEEEASHRFAQEIQRAGERATDLTNQLLVFSHKQVLLMGLLQLNDVLRAKEKFLRSLLGETIELRIHLDPKLPLAMLNQSHMENAILNLVTNAKEAMPSGGVVTLETSNRIISELVSWRNFDLQPGNYVSLTVSDTGRGMDESTQEHLFDPFFTTKGFGKGTGLGLPSVYGIVRLSGGTIQVSSAPNCGTTFRLFFPAKTEDTQPEPSTQSPSEGLVSGRQELILLAEDEPQVRNLTSHTLEDLGYQVLTAADGQEALAHMDRLPAPLKLLISDVVMPGLSGPELVETVRKRFPNLPVLFISGYSAGYSLENRLSENTDFLAKPFLPAQLAARVRTLLGNSRNTGPLGIR